MTVRLPPLEPTRVQRLSLRLYGWRTPLAVVGAVVFVLSGGFGLTLCIPKSSEGWGHPWWGAAVFTVSVVWGLLLVWVQWGPYWAVFEGDTYFPRTPGYWVDECRSAWRKIPAADRAELLPVMRAVYGLGQVNTSESRKLLEARYDVIKKFAAAVRERDDLMNRPWLTPRGTLDMDEAAAKTAMLEDQNRAQREARDQARQAYEDLTGTGSDPTN